MYKIILPATILLFLCLSIPLAANPFNDIPQNHWAYDAVEMLQEKGLVEGYPDGYFKGDRPVTRYEMAMAVARIIARIEQLEASIPQMPDLSVYATKNDLETINKLTEEFHKELDSLGIRVSNIEESIGKITSRVQDLERVKVSGNFNTTAVAIGYAPDKLNTASFGNPFPQLQDLTSGPEIIPDRDRFSGPNGGNGLFSGNAIMSQLNLTVTAKIADKVKAGGDFSAYSAFGDQGVICQWGLVPSYDSMGQIVTINKFQADMSTLWFDTDGDWDITGKFGDYNVKKLSRNLFYGLRNNISYGGKDLMPMNGIDLCGSLYKKVDLEVFMARNINVLRSSDTTGIPSKFRYELANPYNNGAGTYRLFSYGHAAPAQYDNYLQGFWAGHDFLDGSAHIEGAFLRLYEDYASNPSLGTDKNLTAPPKDLIYYGFKGYYTWHEDKIKIYGEFNQTGFDYNLTDNKGRYTGTFLNIGAKVKLSPFSFYGEYIRVSANYDPFGYREHWDKIYNDSHHEGWGWKTGSFACNARRFSRLRPNRTGIDLGIDWKFGEKDSGIIFTDFTYLQQVVATNITNDEDSFQKYNFLTGVPVADTTGVNIYGNMDHFFTEADPVKGKEYNVDAGGKYSAGKFHTWGYFNYHKFSRDYETKEYNVDLAYYVANAGITYDITEKFSAQGFVEYIKASGTNESGKDVKWSQVIPGCGVMYKFSDNADFQIDYKFYDYSASTPYDVYDRVPDPTGNNDYHANKLMTRIRVKF
ncbi:MAG: S-layer homology domain-containing protein [Candidatus Eremiobacterota bacterium]